MTRGRAALARFDDTEDVSALLQAALELRFGIEGRINDYLTAELRRRGRTDVSTSEFRATRLLKLLLRENPKASSQSRVSITSDSSGKSTHLSYTPVIPELASIHGKLGNILHFTFFSTRAAWMVRQRSTRGKLETALDARDLVDRGLYLLEEATKGTLLTNNVFAESVDRMLGEIE